MTLPFISYGGSSLFAVALTMGFALAVTRQRPQLEMRDNTHNPLPAGVRFA
jgi:cell division protein FtsW